MTTFFTALGLLFVGAIVGAALGLLAGAMGAAARRDELERAHRDELLRVRGEEYATGWTHGRAMRPTPSAPRPRRPLDPALLDARFPTQHRN